jgi:4-diphosphocytidyl-2C-methyl-D-erythritol kinase
MTTCLIRRFSLTVGLVVALGCGAAFAQSAGQDMKNAGTDSKNAAVDAGHATKTTTKKVYRKTKRDTRKAYHKTAQGTKTAGDRTANAGDAVAGKPPQHPSSAPPHQ